MMYFKIISVIILVGLISSFGLYKSNSSFANFVAPILQEVGIKEKPLYPYSIEDNKPIVYHAFMDNITYLNV